MKTFRGYPGWFFHSLLCCVLVVTFSGVIMLPALAEFRLEWDVDWHLPADVRLCVAALHVAAGGVLLMALGALWSIHMRNGWRRRINRFSGAGLVVLLLSLAATGLGLYYLGGETTSVVNAVLHTVLGVVLPLLLIWHWWHGLVSTRRAA